MSAFSCASASTGRSRSAVARPVPCSERANFVRQDDTAGQTGSTAHNCHGGTPPDEGRRSRAERSTGRGGNLRGSASGRRGQSGAGGRSGRSTGLACDCTRRSILSGDGGPPRGANVRRTEHDTRRLVPVIVATSECDSEDRDLQFPGSMNSHRSLPALYIVAGLSGVAGLLVSGTGPRGPRLRRRRDARSRSTDITKAVARSISPSTARAPCP